MNGDHDMTPLKTRLGRAVRQNGLYWRYVANARPWLEYRLSRRTSMTPIQESIVNDLRQNGIAITTGRALFGDSALVDELIREVNVLERTMKTEIEEARQRKDAGGFKTFLIQLLGPCPVLNPQSIFVRIAVAPEVLGVANGYFGMLTRLRFYNVWLNFASTAPARYSQLWHRDPEDRYILKMFVYLTDVDEQAGPLFYAPGTHGYGRIKSEPKLFREEGTTALRADDGSMSAVVDNTKWVKAVGPKGTIVFIDTRGYHKGGLARCHDRIAYNCMFTSQGSACNDFFERRSLSVPNSDGALSFALGVSHHT
jgi:hypothetical protein